ncbi:MAG: coniferyl-aldehyde dehydrogenase [Rhodococcus sp. (in: high G+C Gram-positive bacteria)]|nr:coniferyl-aldehyde dehydrogenase [Rhodococcus sp. (in: high G+C Gram-positive bacteria)]
MGSSFPEQLSAVLDRQRRTPSTASATDPGHRVRPVRAMIDLLVQHHKPLTEAVHADFDGQLPTHVVMDDILTSLTALHRVRESLEGWWGSAGRPTYRIPGPSGALWHCGPHHDAGTVAIVGSRTAPLFSLLGPWVSAIGTGHRAVLMPAHGLPRTVRVLADAAESLLDPAHIAVLVGIENHDDQITADRFDHVVVTGEHHASPPGGTATTSVLRPGAAGPVSPHRRTFADALATTYAALLPAVTDHPGLVVTVADHPGSCPVLRVTRPGAAASPTDQWDDERAPDVERWRMPA